MPSYACPTCGERFKKWSVCKAHLELMRHTGKQHECRVDKQSGQLKKHADLPDSAALSDGAAFWVQLLQQEMAAQEEQVQHRLETWSNEALCQEGLRLHGLEARLHMHDGTLTLRSAAGTRLAYNVFALGDVGIVSHESTSVLALGCVTSVSGSMLQLTLKRGTAIDSALLSPRGGTFRIDKGFQQTPFDRMHSAIQRCDQRSAQKERSQVWDAVLPLLKAPTVVTRCEGSPSSAGECGAPCLGSAVAPMSWLNASQQRAVDATLSLPISLIHGPPGTGKTTVLASAVHAALRQRSGTRVLLLAETNTAVDNLVHAVFKRSGSQLAPGELVRVGACSGSVPPELARCSLLALAKAHASAPELSELKEAMLACEKPSQKRRLWERIQQLELAIQHELIANAAVVATTLIGSGSGIFPPGAAFTMFVLDEGTQATLPAALVPLNLLDSKRPEAQRVVFAGDHKQLPPTVISLRAREGGLAVPVFEMLLGAGCPKLLLNTQYRMDAAISAFPLRHFYGGAVSNAPVAERPPSPVAVQLKRLVRWPRSDWPVALVRMEHAWEQVDARGSKVNPCEASAVVDCVARLRRACPTLLASGNDDTAGVAVITHYLGQKALIQTRLRQMQQAHGVVVSTVDGFQGQEAHLVIISMVRANDRGRVGFLADQRRLNVALTRARSGLIVLGHAGTLRADEHLRAWLAWAEDARCTVRSVQELLLPPQPPAQACAHRVSDHDTAKRKAELATHAAKAARAQLEAAEARAQLTAAQARATAAERAAQDSGTATEAEVRPRVSSPVPPSKPLAAQASTAKQLAGAREVLVRLDRMGGDDPEVDRMKARLQEKIAGLESRIAIEGKP